MAEKKKAPRPAEKGDVEQEFKRAVAAAEAFDRPQRTALDEYRVARSLNVEASAAYVCGLVAGRRGK